MFLGFRKKVTEIKINQAKYCSSFNSKVMCRLSCSTVTASLIADLVRPDNPSCYLLGRIDKTENKFMVTAVLLSCL